MLTRSATHAVRALVALAALEPGEYGRTSQIADSAGVPRNYLGKILFLMARRGFQPISWPVALGGMSGIELGRRLAAVGSTTPMIFITAHDDATTRSEAEALGCFAFVSKVETSGGLLKAIVSAVRSQLN